MYDQWQIVDNLNFVREDHTTIHFVSFFSKITLNHIVGGKVGIFFSFFELDLLPLRNLSFEIFYMILFAIPLNVEYQG